MSARALSAANNAEARDIKIWKRAGFWEPSRAPLLQLALELGLEVRVRVGVEVRVRINVEVEISVGTCKVIHPSPPALDSVLKL